ncbi:tRNA 2-thiouridine(34) synthase MnmA [Candidatus Wirthbacteria bacterium CG2_30_54_11]|uniref:tRNA-specific 2-thiouridylase MnmA n=1 Tax=Candidatus Wirthbacteria bacterium CG2_30_54_11 TaxID=1817892 RepID=A0A1J5J2I5_9BACT|nr:MAG: tRNA 2-thiouridine(34) synthase MnmA [Candidatus Wirthbacteria bacterium CG2_30_54_11]
MSKAEISSNKVLVAMSGGVDSSVAAALLVEAGFQVAGVHLKFWSSGVKEEEQNVCCSLASQGDARRVCDVLGIPFQVWDAEDMFYHEVVKSYLSELRYGRTPNPCVICNERIKLGWLIDRAAATGFDMVATGHWARIEHETDGRLHLFRSVNEAKDQSYFLYRVTKEHLARVLFPLGDFKTKDQVRDIARRYQLPTGEKSESQEICFIPDGDREAFIRRFAPDTLETGPVKDTAGKTLGEHQGLALYTEGQRKGIKIAAANRLYVTRKDVKRNTLILGDLEATGSLGLLAADVVWLEPVSFPVKAEARIRFRGAGLLCTVTQEPDDRLKVSFDTAAQGVAPGQSVVFYQGDRILGGAIIRVQDQMSP